jgi:hypothetical protein
MREKHLLNREKNVKKYLTSAVNFSTTAVKGHV